MLKIGDFSILGKVTIKTLRYYEEKGLLKPIYIDKYSNYRYYDTSQLITLARIISLKQVGLKINDIKKILDGSPKNDLLLRRKQDIEKELSVLSLELQRINYLRKGDIMYGEVIIKELPDYIVYYKEGVIKSFENMPEFIMGSAKDCLKDNPDMKCIEPDYCYVSYLDREYKPHDIKIRYSQAVTKMGKENETIKFMKLEKVEAACIYHKGSYENLRDTYSHIIKWVTDNGYEIADSIRERYIDGIWNKEDPKDWLTEIEVPIIKRA